MTDIETTVENARAQYHYPPIRTALLPSDTDELQLQLADRLRRHRHQHALEVIADLGRVFDAEEALPAIEALGRLLVHASLLAGCERMAIAPIIALGRKLTRDSGVSSELPLKPAAVLAHVALNHWREPADVVRGLAMAIAKAIDDCEIVHELKIDPLELFKVAAREVLDGKPVTAMTTPAVQPDKAALRAEAWTELRKASEAVVADDLKQVPDGEPVVLSQRPPEKCQMCGASGDVQDDDPEIWTCANGHHVRYCTRKAWDPDGGRPVNPDVVAAAAMVQYEVAEDGMGEETDAELREQALLRVHDGSALRDGRSDGELRDAIKAELNEGPTTPDDGTFAGIDRTVAPFSLQNLPPQRPFTPEMIRDAVEVIRRRSAYAFGAPACPGCGATMSPVSGSPGEWTCNNLQCP